MKWGGHHARRGFGCERKFGWCIGAVGQEGGRHREVGPRPR
jgi:hypothetical protein